MKRFFIPLALLCVLTALLAAAILFRAHSTDAAAREAGAALLEADEKLQGLTAENEGLRAENGRLKASLDQARAEAAEQREEAAALEEELQQQEEDSAALTAALELPGVILESRRFTEHTASTSRFDEFHYYLYEPGVPADGPLPLILFLHGSGGELDIHDGKTLPTMLESGWLSPNAIVLMPQCPDKNWDECHEDVMELLEAVVMEYGADRSRISVTGFSLGGVGTFSMLVNYPDYFSAAVALAAKCFPEKCGVITSTPLRILHGEEDTGMDPSSVKEATEVINAAGGNCTLTMLPGEGHLIAQHYLDEGGELIDWLIAQRRTDK